MLNESSIDAFKSYRLAFGLDYKIIFKLYAVAVGL